MVEVVPAARDERLREGQCVAGKYVVASVIGEGAMGVVYSATHTELHHPVALKVLKRAAAASDELMARFRREARAVIALQSEHVARVMDFGSLADGRPYIVMEQLEGADLEFLVRLRGALPLDEAVDYVLQACRALGEAHARGIVHRDLKPANLFVTRRFDGVPFLKVLDFGIASEAASHDATAPALTVGGAVLGTALYMSPEQVRSTRSVDARSDVWSLGVVLYNVLTESHPFPGDSFSAVCAAIVADTPRPMGAAIPREMQAVVLRCLEKDPMHRFADVAALAAALMPFATTAGQKLASRAGKARPPVAMADSGRAKDAGFAHAPTVVASSARVLAPSGRKSPLAASVVVSPRRPVPDAKVRRTTAALSQYEPSVRGYVLAAFRASVEELWSRAGIDQIASELSDEARDEMLGERPLAAWISERSVMEWCFAVWNGPAQRQRSLYSQFLLLHVHHGFGRLRRALLQLASPKALLDRAPKLWAEDHTHGELEVDWCSSTSVDARLRDHPYTELPQARATIAEVLRHTLSLTRAKNVTETHRLEQAGVLLVRLAWG